MTNRTAWRYGTARRRRGGFALIDAILALTLLSLTAVGFIALLRQTTLSFRLAGERDRAVRSAGAALATVTVRDAAWLDEHFGQTRYRSWILRIERLSPALHRAALLDTLNGHVWVETTLYHAVQVDSSASQR